MTNHNDFGIRYRPISARGDRLLEIKHVRTVRVKIFAPKQKRDRLHRTEQLFDLGTYNLTWHRNRVKVAPDSNMSIII